MNSQKQVLRSLYLKRAGLGFLAETTFSHSIPYSPSASSSELRVPIPSGGLGIS